MSSVYILSRDREVIQIHRNVCFVLSKLSFTKANLYAKKTTFAMEHAKLALFGYRMITYSVWSFSCVIEGRSLIFSL